MLKKTIFLAILLLLITVIIFACHFLIQKLYWKYEIFESWCCFMEQEYIFSGFCRTFNQGQTVTCEFTEREGKMELFEADCAYERCIHKGSCQIAKEIRNILKEEHGGEEECEG